MKRKRIQYNELSDEIYAPKYWTKPRLILTGLFLLVVGFLFNFSLEDKLNNWLLTTLSNNEACPIIFEKAELSYFLPKINIKKPVILGTCFGQPGNKLPLQELVIALNYPSFYPPGIKLHISAKEGKTNINLYPILSPMSQYLDIENTKIDNKIFAAMSIDNKSSLGGMLTIEGSLKFNSGILEDGALHISSNDFHLPPQNIKGFEMTLLNLKHIDIKTHFTNKLTMQIDHIEVGQAGSPIELNLKGNLILNSSSFLSSQLQLSGPLKLSNYILVNFAFIKLFLPAENTSGTYQMKINGLLGNMGPPQIK
ncbi:MAG: hypothetical protein Q7U04_04825 [Bacteriovorax sp.]|nr:hypothetical protein [Bacteriovorax sp.]